MSTLGVHKTYWRGEIALSWPSAAELDLDILLREDETLSGVSNLCKGQRRDALVGSHR